MSATMKIWAALPLAIVLLSACEPGIRPYTGSNALVAVPEDRGIDGGGLVNGEAAIVYDPDGCQGWLIDDGIEGYSGRRFDPVSGLPICNNLYPPGTLLGKYQTTKHGPFNDWVKGTYQYVDNGGTATNITRKNYATYNGQ